MTHPTHRHSQCLLVFLVLIASPLAPHGLASEKDKKAEPIRALLVTGGCCHDYGQQKTIIPEGLSARTSIPIEWTVAHQGGSNRDVKIPVYQDPGWTEGYDVVVHNECFARVRDKAWARRIMKPHEQGTGAVLIHCAMHSYRLDGDAWFRFCGVRSHGHGAKYPYTVENRATDDPIMEGLGEAWTVPKGELYHIAEVYEGVKVLAEAKRRKDKKPQACVWRHRYGEGRVFGTTVGHYNQTMAHPKYQGMLVRGFLWAAGRLDEGVIHKARAAAKQRDR